MMIDDLLSPTPAPAGAAPPAPEPDAKSSGDGDAEPLPVHWQDVLSSISLGFIFAITMLLGILFARPFQAAGFQAFENPENPWNSVGYIVLLIAFTFVILWIAKKGQKWLIRLIILGAVAGTMVYVAQPFLEQLLGWSSTAAWIGGAGVGIACAVALYYHPEWYVIDIVGVLVAAGAAAIFGISLGLVPVVLLLVVLAVYDAIAVYKTKHMLALADSVMELRLPVLLVIPKHWGYRFRDEVARFKDAAEEGGDGHDREALFMGLGDLVFPAVLVVSIMAFHGAEWGWTPIIACMVGTLLGYSVLIATVLRGKPQAGLPLLNGGAIVGFLVGLYMATGSLVFW